MRLEFMTNITLALNMKENIVALYNSLYELIGHSNDNHQKGASKDALQTLENDIGHSLPPELKTLYLTHNGESEAEAGIFSGYIFLDIDAIYYSIQDLEEDSKNFNELEKWPCYPKNTVKKVPYNSNWIPIARDNTGGYIGLDFDPDIEGIYGQIINFGAFEYTRVQVSTDFTTFILELANGYKNKKYHGCFDQSVMSIVDTVIDRLQA